MNIRRHSRGSTGSPSNTKTPENLFMRALQLFAPYEAIQGLNSQRELAQRKRATASPPTCDRAIARGPARASKAPPTLFRSRPMSGLRVPEVKQSK
jgi:hypothetical protein